MPNLPIKLGLRLSSGGGSPPHSAGAVSSGSEMDVDRISHSNPEEGSRYLPVEGPVAEGGPLGEAPLDLDT